ncbi:MAG: hypothetical protein IJI98_11050 [Methanosphaera sp.]|nr:hypothetical protein [Methanobrevibacter sp.]MBQ6754225.1 hypothetical protein [Bacteroidales bacterium]MBR0351331.1 hypothetical protein [Clostridia bacterium]MBR0473216.1 hypothetical protein [Methanosphaera sp.]
MKSFTIYEEYFDLITILPKEEEQKDLLYKIAEYMFYDKEPTLNKNQTKIFNNLKRPLNKSKTKSKATSNQNQNEIKMESKTNQNENTSNDVNVNVNGNVFKKPTLEEVEEYCRERNNNVDAETFINFYESKGWFVGKNKMKDWKACVRTWEKKSKHIIAKEEKTVPDWFEQQLENQEPTKEEQREMEEALNI